MASLLASRLCGSTTLRVAILKQVPYKSTLRTYAEEGKNVVSRVARRQTLKERALAPAGEGGLLKDNFQFILTKLCNIFTAFSIGKGALAGGSLLGLGALCYYGLGFSNEAGALEKSA